MLRKIARRLLPENIRRPIAAFYYRLYASGKRSRHLLPIWEMASGKCSQFLLLSGEKVAAHIHLLDYDRRELTIVQYLQRMFLTSSLAIHDRYYRFCFSRYGKALNRLSLEKNSRYHSGIIFMIGTLGPGGAERQATLTLTGLAKRGIRPVRMICHFLHHEGQCFFLPFLESAGIPAEELDRTLSNDRNNQGEPLGMIMKSLPPSLQDACDYRYLFSAERPKLVHLWMDEINIKGGIAAVAAGIPRIVLGLRSLPPQHFSLYKPYMREGYCWLAKQPGVVMLNNSVAGARAYEKWLGLPRGVIRVVTNGFDFDKILPAKYHEQRKGYRARHHIPAEAQLLGTVIRLSEEKRPLLWLEIAASIRHQLPDIHFLIAGDGPLRAMLEKRAHQTDLRGSIHFTGYEKDAHTAIAAMDMFLLTSRAEGLPNVLIEAQALGVPAVTTRVGGAPEAIQHGKTGWVLEEDDCQRIANVMVKLLQDQEWLAHARQNASAFVRKTFGLERMLDDTLAAYDIDREELW